MFFFNHPATTEIYTLSLHDALPIWVQPRPASCRRQVPPLGSHLPPRVLRALRAKGRPAWGVPQSKWLYAGLQMRAEIPDYSAAFRYIRSEEHTSELQSL